MTDNAPPTAVIRRFGEPTPESTTLALSVTEMLKAALAALDEQLDAGTPMPGGLILAHATLLLPSDLAACASPLVGDRAQLPCTNRDRRLAPVENYPIDSQTDLDRLNRALWCVTGSAPIPAPSFDAACLLLPPQALATLQALPASQREAWLRGHCDLAGGLAVYDPAAPPFARPAAPENPSDEHPIAMLDATAARAGDLLAHVHGVPAAIPLPCAASARLHVIHAWGGGVRRFVNDFLAGDARPSFVLMASGGENDQVYGKQLELKAHPDGPPIETYTLPRPMGAVAIERNDYRQILRSLCARFAIGEIVVSSLIGHSLDCLRTGLPTVVVHNDYFPAWPDLNIRFDGDATFGSNEEQIAAQRSTQWFPDMTPATWQQVRSAYIAALDAEHVVAVAPSQSVADNLQRIDPALAPQQCIAHGVPPLRRVRRQADGDDRLRLVLLGRVSAGKGLGLLQGAFQDLTQHADLVALGTGREGMALFAKAGIDVIVEYERDQLPHILESLRVDAALLLSTVAETFSYTLSELLMMGVPVIATKVGSFSERLSTEHGWLIAPEPQALAAKVAEIAADPQALAARWQALESFAHKPLGAMVADYDALLPKRSPATLLAAGDDLLARMARTQIVVQQHRQRATLQALQTRFVALNDELAARARWAEESTALAEQRLDWARQLEAALATANDHVERLDALAAERTRWAQDLDSQLNRARKVLASQQAALANQQVRLAANAEHIAQLEQALSHTEQTLGQRTQDLARATATIDERTQWALGLDREIERLQQIIEQTQAARDRHYGELTALLNSRSWTMTKPYRWLGRRLKRVAQRLARARYLLGRTRRSMQARGLRGTWQRIKTELARRQQVAKGVTLPKWVEFDPASFKPLNFPKIAEPTVSIVIPVYNQFGYTYRCLQSLRQRFDQGPSFEVIVVDDCSVDETVRLLPDIGGIIALRNAENGGFIYSCNRGVAAARGEFIVLLNNDTTVTDQWLSTLIDTFDSHPDAGLVGARLVYPDGRLQEAGGIVFADASGWNYGRFEDPDVPDYQYVREADYCSGAAIAIRRTLFDQLGGFDTRYTPAYYEDTDLAFAVRAAGRKVYIQPRSNVIHHEGITSGTDLNSGVKRYQVVNQRHFAEKWQQVLATHPAPSTDILRAREHRQQAGMVLVIDACTPTPDQDSGSVRMVNLLRLLRDLGYQVTFFADNLAFEPGYTDAIQQLGVEVLYYPHLHDREAFLRERGPLLDAVIISRHYIASQYTALVREHAPQARLIFDTVDLHYLREQRLAVLENDAAMATTARATKAAELKVAQDSDVTVVVSPVEVEVLAKDAPGVDVKVLSNIHRVIGCRRGFAERSGIMFVGGYQHPPNIDAVQWFANDILPLVRAKVSDLTFHIIGSRAPKEVERLGKLDGVQFHGFVEDMAPFLDGCRLAVAPLRYGAGVKGKVNTSMSYGQPVVATSPAVEGMFATPGEDVMVADDEQAFADAIIEAYTDPQLWQRLSDGGLKNVETYFSLDAARQALAEILAHK